ncbi:MAG: dihydroorotase [Prevotellaceae bacterium]|jgi:dihydroorotase|nr:dihydroorotase [Prevotellaceae bacterium]
MNYYIKNADILNEGMLTRANVLIENERIKQVSEDEIILPADTTVIDAQGKLLMPGIIDDHVHFREPGLTHKGDMFSESRAAAAGGVTSFMDMPNTLPPTMSIDDLEHKREIAEHNSLINYSFYLGASAMNIGEIKKVDPCKVCGIKVFIGSSTGDLLVDEEKALSAIFAESPVIIAAHCEDENTIKENIARYKQKFGDDIPVEYHSVIRNAEACYKSAARTVELALRYNSRLHVLHLSTAKETGLFVKSTAGRIPRITAEVCTHHLWFSEKDCKFKGNKIKCNPAIKSEYDREILRNAVKNGRITVIATDHAPHTIDEKRKKYFNSPSGIPYIQHSLSAMLEMHKQGVFSLFDIVERMCHCPARIFGIRDRGFIREGYFADLVLIDLNTGYRPSPENILSKCRWSPFESVTFSTKVETTWVNGSIVYDNGEIIEAKAARSLEFNR